MGLYKDFPGVTHSGLLVLVLTMGYGSEEAFYSEKSILCTLSRV